MGPICFELKHVVCLVAEYGKDVWEVKVNMYICIYIYIYLSIYLPIYVFVIDASQFIL